MHFLSTKPEGVSLCQTVSRRLMSGSRKHAGSMMIAVSAVIAMTGHAETTEANAGCPQLLASAASVVSMDQPRPAPLSSGTKQSCEISFEELQAKPRTIIDVRDSNAYAKVSLQGALNLPVSSLRHRQFLKSQAIVLIDDGKTPSALVRACGELKEQGFIDIRVLIGGLRTLHANGAALTADARSIQGLYHLTASEFDSEAGRPGWLTVGVDIDAVSGAKNNVALHESIDTSSASKTIATQLRAMLARRADGVLILAATNDTFKRESVVALSPAEASRVLILTGGLEGQRRYQAQQASVVAQAGKPLVRPCSES